MATPAIKQEWATITGEFNDEESKSRFSKYAVANANMNRYNDVLPYEETRVLIPIIPEDHQYPIPEAFVEYKDSYDRRRDYINASYITIDGPSKIILTQAPQPATVDTFWWMVWHHNIEMIGMFTSFEEAGRTKAMTYWPKREGQVLNVLGGKLSIINQGVHVLPAEPVKIGSSQTDETSEVYDLLLSYSPVDGEISYTKEVTHFHYRSWPDKEVPQRTENLIFFLHTLSLLRKKNVHNGSLNTTPFVFHCSAGIGRAGTMAASFRHITTKEPIFDVVRSIRKDRHSLVQTGAQYAFVYRLTEAYMRAYPRE